MVNRLELTEQSEGPILTPELASKLAPTLRGLPDELPLNLLRSSGATKGHIRYQWVVGEWYTAFSQCSDTQRRQITQTIRALDRGLNVLLGKEDPTIGDFKNLPIPVLQDIRNIGEGRLQFACDLLGRS